MNRIETVNQIKLTSLTLCCLPGVVLVLSMLAAHASDDMLVYTEILNNEWGDWGWVPHYATNNPTFNGTDSMVLLDVARHIGQIRQT